MKLSGTKHPLDTMLLASIVDRLSVLAWMKTKDGANGVNQPKSILFQLMGKEEESDIEAFDTPEEFEKRRKEVLGKGGE